MNGTSKKEKMTIIMFSGELDKVLAGFTLANTAASMGMDVYMFFTFWGINIIRKNISKNRSKRFAQKMFGVLNKGGVDRLPLSKFHMLGIGTSMMKRLMQKTKVDSINEMIELAKSLGVKFMACTMSMEIMGITAENLISEVDGICGAAAYLAEAKKSSINLFI